MPIRTAPWCAVRPTWRTTGPTLLNPMMIVEVVSCWTSSFERGDKFRHYRSIPSLSDYVVVDSEEVSVEHFRRADNGEWVLRVYTDLEDRVFLPAFDETLRSRSCTRTCSSGRLESATPVLSTRGSSERAGLEGFLHRAVRVTEASCKSCLSLDLTWPRCRLDFGTAMLLPCKLPLGLSTHLLQLGDQLVDQAIDVRARLHQPSHQD